MKVYVVMIEGLPEVCLNKSNAQILANKFETEIYETETVDDYQEECEKN